jgi:hypothetical protein
MKRLQKFISNNDRWIIEETERGYSKLAMKSYLSSGNAITFVNNDIGELIGLLTKFEQALRENKNE